MGAPSRLLLEKSTYWQITAWMEAGSDFAGGFGTIAQMMQN